VDTCRTEESVLIHKAKTAVRGRICITSSASRPELEESCPRFLSASLLHTGHTLMRGSRLSDQQEVFGNKEIKEFLQWIRSIGLSVPHRKHICYEPNSLMLSIGLWRWYINITVTILGIIHHPVFYLKLNSTLQVCPYLTGNTLRLRYEPNRLMLSIGLWQWYINITITILDINPSSCLLFETGRFGNWVLSLSSGGTYSGNIGRASLSPDTSANTKSVHERIQRLSPTRVEIQGVKMSILSSVFFCVGFASGSEMHFLFPSRLADRRWCTTARGIVPRGVERPGFAAEHSHVLQRLRKIPVVSSEQVGLHTY
jgi:hypothetical protein